MDKSIEFAFGRDKEYFSKKIASLDADIKALIQKQMDRFYNSYENSTGHTYSIGDSVKLDSNTLLHGVREKEHLIDRLQSIKDYGIISRTFVSDRDDWKVNYCISAWHIKKATTLLDYIRLYSGMTVRTALKENVMIPYGEFDNYIESIKNKDYKYIFAEHSMENTFLPSLISNLPDKQLALIIHSRDKTYTSILKNNLFSNNNPNDTIKKFLRMSDYDKVLNNRHTNEYNRIAYIPFGIPSTYIEGIMVGRKIESNKTLLSKIKTIFPQCYICNLDGIVIL